MIRLDQEDSSFLKTSHHYQAVVDSDVIISGSPDRRQKMMTYAVLYCILALFYFLTVVQGSFTRVHVQGAD